MFPSFQSFSYICRTNAGFRSGFCWLKSGEKNILIIYAPRECPSGSEGQTCGEIWPDSVPVFVGLKVGKKIY